MTSNEKEQTRSKPLVIANPIYDTVFKKLMENMKIVKFFLSTILGQEVTAVQVLPQEFTHKITEEEKAAAEKAVAEAAEKDKVKIDIAVPYSIYRTDFMATVLSEDGKYRKILIEVQKSLGAVDIPRFRKYLGEQYSKTNTVIVDKDNQEMTLPITTIYILGDKLTKITCSCLKVERTYIDMLTDEPVSGRNDFIEKLTHDSYVIQIGRITDSRYSTALEKLLSIFEQSYFVDKGSEVLKEYPYQPLPEDEDIRLITDTLHEIAADDEERKQIESEAEYIRSMNYISGVQAEEVKQELKEVKQALEESEKARKEDRKALEEKDKIIEEDKKALEESEKARKEDRKALEESEKARKEDRKAIEDLSRKLAELERRLQNKQ
jgi:hypothetical protein